MMLTGSVVESVMRESDMASKRKNGQRSGRQQQARDYKAEYQRRKVHAAARGLSVSQARGHPKANEAGIFQARRNNNSDRRLDIAVRELRRKRSLDKAAKEAKVSVERLRRHLAQSGIAEQRGKRWVVREDVPRWMPIFSEGELELIKVKGRKASSPVGRYMNAVKDFVNSGDASHLAPFKGRAITDTRGKVHRFETDPNTLYELSNDEVDPFEQYRIG